MADAKAAVEDCRWLASWEHDLGGRCLRRDAGTTPAAGLETGMHLGNGAEVLATHKRPLLHEKIALEGQLRAKERELDMERQQVAVLRDQLAGQTLKIAALELEARHAEPQLKAMASKLALASVAAERVMAAVEEARASGEEFVGAEQLADLHAGSQSSLLAGRMCSDSALAQRVVEADARLLQVREDAARFEKDAELERRRLEDKLAAKELERKHLEEKLAAEVAANLCAPVVAARGEDGLQCAEAGGASRPLSAAVDEQIAAARGLAGANAVVEPDRLEEVRRQRDALQEELEGCRAKLELCMRVECEKEEAQASLVVANRQLEESYKEENRVLQQEVETLRENLAQTRQSLDELVQREHDMGRQEQELQDELARRGEELRRVRDEMRILGDEMAGVSRQREDLVKRLREAEHEVQQARAGREREKAARKEAAEALERDKEFWEQERKQMTREWEERVGGWEENRNQEREREGARMQQAVQEANRLEREVQHLQLEVKRLELDCAREKEWREKEGEAKEGLVEAKMAVDAALSTAEKELSAEREARAREREAARRSEDEDSARVVELGEAMQEIDALKVEVEMCRADAKESQGQVAALREENSLMQVEVDTLRSNLQGKFVGTPLCVDGGVSGLVFVSCDLRRLVGICFCLGN